MPKLMCEQCGERFESRDKQLPVCPWCHAIDAAHKQCWRCKQIFCAVSETITCDDCQAFLSRCCIPSELYRPESEHD